MRHRKSGRSLSRNWEHRKAMFRNMAKSLVTHEKIKTTLPKAKELSRVADRLVPLALRGDLSAKREAYKVLGDHKLVKRLFDDIAPRFDKRSGGYTRVVKYARPRVGDSASLALIEFTYETATEPQAKKTRTEESTAAKTSPAAAPVIDAGTAEKDKESFTESEREKSSENEAQARESEEAETAAEEKPDTVQVDKAKESESDETGEDPERAR